MSKIARYLLLLCGLQLLAASALAADQLLDVRQMDGSAVSLTQYFAVLEDPSLALTLADVQKPSYAARFQTERPAGQALNFGYTRSAYWLRLRLANSAAQPSARMLEIGYARLGTIELYRPDANGNYQALSTGSVMPFAARPYPNRYFVFALELPAHSEQLYYLRIHTKSPLVIPGRLWQPQAFHAYERNDYLIQAWYYGMATAMVLFNLLLFIALREIIYLLYVNAVVCMVLTIAANNGLTKEFLWPDSPLWSEISVGVGYSVAVAAMLLFTRQMLNTRKLMASFDPLLKALCVALLLSPIGFVLAYQTFIQAATVLYGLAAVLILGSGLFCAFKRQRSAYFFVAAFAVMGIAGVLNALRLLGLLPTNIVTQNGLQFGSALEMLLLALALADRFNAVRRDKAKAQQEALQAEQRVTEALRSSERLLEGRVSARTAELSATVERLKQTQAELLQAEKLASLGALVAGVAHELNTPIGNALTTASALEHVSKELQTAMNQGELRRSALTHFIDNAVPMAELIGRSCQRAATLISSFKQVAVDQTSEQRRSFDLRALVEDNIAAIRPSFKHAPWVINTEIPAGINCDSYPGPLGQVIANLIQNAMTHAFTGRAQGTLSISASLKDQRVEMRFSDDGKGMEANILAHIFDPFYTTQLGQGGSGLGLSIALNIVTGVLGGTLQVSTEPGQGSCFTLNLPLSAPLQAEAKSGPPQSG